MGYRGILHNDQQIIYLYQHKAWIICCLNPRRIVTSPGKYTDLFFLDETTALVARQRSHFEC
ncbi:MAG: hypothetical protein KA773_10130 [Chloroflexi bacterium]|nr:hypothetical protein [Chloroflexota bacterium]